MKSQLLKSWSVRLIVGLLFFYFCSRLINLNALPVFADEAIYIRWAQLIMDDAKQYLFFPLNDGKTPLFIWLLVPFQYLASDQLLAGRILSVILGLVQLWVLCQLARIFNFSRRAVVTVALLAIAIPFWHFYQRMALMDGMLTLLLSCSLLFLIQAQQLSPPKIQKNRYLKFGYLLATGLFFGLSLWTKLSAILFAPSLFFSIWYYGKQTKSLIFKNMFSTILVVIIGLFCFLLLKLHPAFSQLFARGGDFLFSPSEVITGEWRFVLHQLPKYFDELNRYLTFWVLIAPLLGLVFFQRKRFYSISIISILVYLLPIFLLGRVVYARYFLPTTIYFTLSAGLLIDQLIGLVQVQVNLWKKAVLGLVAAVFISNIFTQAAGWQYKALFAVDTLDLPANDRQQYLEEWSAGQGIWEVSSKLMQVGQNQRVVLATEGYFGTLPDGILMYLHRRNVDNIFVMGIGQPVNSLPAEFITKAQDFDQAWLVVNSHRLKMSLPADLLLAKYCRSNSAPCLQLWDVSTLIKIDMNSKK